MSDASPVCLHSQKVVYMHVLYSGSTLHTIPVHKKLFEMDIATGVTCTNHTDFKNIALFEA